MKRISQYGSLIAVFLLFAALVAHPETVKGAVSEGIALCTSTLIPALFPFLVCSSLAVSLGGAALLGKVFRPLTATLFRLGEGSSAALALGLLGGYPVGAQTLRELVEGGQCTPGEAERALASCNNCGFAFILGVAGSGVFHSAKVGWMLLAGHWLGALTVGLLFRFYGKTANSSPYSAPVTVISLPTALKRAMQNALSALGNICAYTLFFRVVVRLAEKWGGMDAVRGLPGGAALLTGLLDLTGGISALDPAQPFVVETAAFLLAFGGLCVLCQTAAVLEDSGIRLRTALIGKILHGVLAAWWTHLVLSPQSSALSWGIGVGKALFFIRP